jgi:ParB-like chromosome segregation protein Spo0J
MATIAPTDLQIVPVPIDDLRPDPANPRRISDQELDALTRSLREFGFVQPVLVRHEDKMVIGGHQRLLAARRLGWKTVLVIFLDVTDEQAHLLNLALNRISGEWDEQLLARLLVDLKTSPEVDLSLSGFSDEELQRFLKKLEAEDKRERVETFDLAAAFAEVDDKPTLTQPGDLWLLGDHRLLCGDATSEDDVARLFDGKQAVLMATDPPYLVDYTGGEHPPTKANQVKANRNKNWDEYDDP